MSNPTYTSAEARELVEAVVTEMLGATTKALDLNAAKSNASKAKTLTDEAYQGTRDLNAAWNKLSNLSNYATSLERVLVMLDRLQSARPDRQEDYRDQVATEIEGALGKMKQLSQFIDQGDKAIQDIAKNVRLAIQAAETALDSLR
jgi:hypothetical protein